MEGFRYIDCEIKQYNSLLKLSEQLVILQSLKHSEKNEKGFKHICSVCNVNYKRIYKDLSEITCSSCYKVKNEEYGKCISCNSDCKLIKNRCFICNEIEDVKEGIKDFINYDKRTNVCEGCMVEKGSTEYRSVFLNNRLCGKHLCKYCFKNDYIFEFDFQINDVELDVHYEFCIQKIFDSIILLSNQMCMLNYMKKKFRREIGYRTYCDKCKSNSMRISEVKAEYLCSSCEKKEDGYGKCEMCNNESKLHNNKCFICIDIECVKEGILDYVEINDKTKLCKDCNIEKKSTEYIKIENNKNETYYLNLCKYCYSRRVLL